jgi:hypothetical protein
MLLADQTYVLLANDVVGRHHGRGSHCIVELQRIAGPRMVVEERVGAAIEREVLAQLRRDLRQEEIGEQRDVAIVSLPQRRDVDPHRRQVKQQVVLEGTVRDHRDEILARRRDDPHVELPLRAVCRPTDGASLEASQQPLL